MKNEIVLDDILGRRKKFARLKRILLILGVTTITLLAILNYNHIEEKIGVILGDQIENFGYAAIIFAVFLLEAVPQPFVSALVPFTTGFFLGLDFHNLVIITLITAISANYLAYFFGYYYSDTIGKFLVNPKNYEKSLRWFEKYGKKGIAILALTPLPYFPIMGGVFKMSLKDFSIYAIIPRILHFLTFAYLLSFIG